MLSVSGPFWPWRRVYQRTKCCKELTSIDAQVLPRPCLYCWQDCARTQACFVFTLKIVHLLGPPTPEETARYECGWMQEMERLGYRNRFLPLIRAPKESRPPRGVWPHALTQVAILPDVIFEVLCCKPNVVPSEDTGSKAAKDIGAVTSES
jgi:hypothetical protein